MFCSAIVLGVLSALRMRELFEFHQVAVSPMSLWDFILPFALITLLVVFIVYLLRSARFKKWFFKLFFLFAIVLGNLYFLGLWFPAVVAFPILAFLLFLLIKRPSASAHNMALIFAIAGIGAAVGSQLTAETIVILFLLFALYDFVAVYKTKHMVKMAEAMVENKAIVGLIVPREASDFCLDLNKTPIKGNFLILGGGDIVFPLILVVAMLEKGLLPALIVALFALLGLLAVFLIFIFQKIQKPMPALPPLALFCVIGYFIGKIL